MSIPEFFIKRPVFATVINVLLIVLGILSYQHLSVREYPVAIAPEVKVWTIYPNADAELVESSVTAIFEDGFSGVEGLDLMKSESREEWSQVSMRFKMGVSMDRALANVRDKLMHIQGKLPKECLSLTVELEGEDSRPFIYLSLTSPTIPAEELIHYAKLNILNPLKVIPGIASAVIHGSEYTMVINLDSQKLFNYGLNVEDISKALQQYNVKLAGGKLRKQVPIIIKTTLENVSDFENAVIKQEGDSFVLLRDIASVELKADTSFRTRVNEQPGILIVIQKSSDGNPLMISQEVSRLLPAFQKQLPKGMDLSLQQDNSIFIKTSLGNIKNTIIEAVVLVVIVVFVFLRRIRSILIPLVAIPISLIAVLALMDFFGFSINTITLLALMLSIGIVVDDAIIVLENTHRHIEDGLSPMKAAMKGGRELGFSILAMTLTLASVFLPIVFIRGMIGQIFVEFGWTLVGAVAISGVVALTLSPVMCARFLNRNERVIFPQFDRFMKAIEIAYGRFLGFALRRPAIILVFTLLVFSGCIYFYAILPKQLVPKEDRGYMGVYVEPVPGLSLDELDERVKDVESLIASFKEVKTQVTYMGFWGSWTSFNLNDWSSRDRSVFELQDEMTDRAKAIPSLAIWPNVEATGLPGLERDAKRSTEVKVVIQTVGSYKELYEYMQGLTNDLNKADCFDWVSHDLNLKYPGYKAILNDQRMAALGITPSMVSRALVTQLGKDRAFKFKKDGINYDVIFKGLHAPNTVDGLYVMSNKGERISLGTLVELESYSLPAELKHYNRYRSAKLEVTPKQGQSIEQVLNILEQKLEETLPENMRYEYTGSILRQKESAKTLWLLIGLAIVFSYAILAIQFESFSDPLLILLTVPMAALGGLLCLWLKDQSVNIFTQIGMITLIGLITRHGVLVVDFTNRLQREGQPLLDAIQTASRLRLRPILMTTFSTVLGHMPLLFAVGAGSESRIAIGYMLVGGIAFGTMLTLVMIPSFYLMIKQRVDIE